MKFTKLAAEKIKEKRQYQGMSKSELAKRIGKTNQTIDNLESGKSVRADIYDKVFEVLNITIGIDNGISFNEV